LAINPCRESAEEPAVLPGNGSQAIYTRKLTVPKIMKVAYSEKIRAERPREKSGPGKEMPARRARMPQEGFFMVGYAVGFRI